MLPMRAADIATYAMLLPDMPPALHIDCYFDAACCYCCPLATNSRDGAMPYVYTLLILFTLRCLRC